jgi:hypothetical protein
MGYAEWHMRLADLFKDSIEFHSIIHRRTKSDTYVDVANRAQGLQPIMDALHDCISVHGQNCWKIKPEEELAIMMATVLLIDDALQYVTETRKVQ